MELKGKVALVTGGAIRVGQAISIALARQGAHVVVNYLHSERQAQEMVEQIMAMGQQALAIQADVSRPQQVRAMVEATVSRFQRLDILINNAGIYFRRPFLELTEEEWDRVMATNLKGAFLCAQQVAPHMQRQRSGKIINIADIGGLRPWPNYLHYCVSKAGLIMLTRGLALALAPDIQVNAVAPGSVLWPESMDETTRQRLRERIPLGREGSAEDVAATVLFLLTGSNYITGQIIGVDGGRLLL